MHYRNGREAKDGDQVVSLGGDGKIQASGILHGADSDYSYMVAPPQLPVDLCNCLHADDVAELIQQAGLDKRPTGK